MLDAKPGKDGYLVARRKNSDGVHKVFYHHALVSDAFICPRPPGYEIDHVDGNRTNNRPENLRYLTHAENVRQSALNGRSMRGERHVSAVITEEQAREILATYVPIGRGVRGRPPHPRGPFALSNMYGVTRKTIHRLIIGETWKHLSVERAAMRLRTGLPDHANSETADRRDT